MSNESATSTPHSDERIRVLLADDHAVLRAGLRALLSVESDLSLIHI